MQVNTKFVQLPIWYSAVFFFLAWKPKVGVKAILGHFWDFFTGTFGFSRPLFAAFLTFFTPKKFVSRALFWDCPIFFTGRKFDVSGAKIWFLCICPWKFLRNRVFRKFSRAKNAFHAHFFVNFQNFSRVAFCFSRAKWTNIRNFSREPFVFSRPKKKH